jgi:hypothetical protein
MNPKFDLAFQFALEAGGSDRVPPRRNRNVSMGMLALVLCILPAVRAQEAKPPYPAMAPIEQYLMADRSAEIALARSAAPEALSRDATVLVLGKNGYETAIDGKNGFTCLVERSWMSPFDSPDFWNPKLRGPVCYNPAAVRSILPYTLNRTKLVLAGTPKARMHESIVAAVAKGELPVPETGAMSYMMAKDGYLGDSAGHWQPTLCFTSRRPTGRAGEQTFLDRRSCSMMNLRMFRNRKLSSWCPLDDGRMGHPRIRNRRGPVRENNYP